MQPTLQDVVAILQKQGQTDDQITDFVDNLTKAAFTRLYGNLIATLSDQEIDEIEALSDQEQADAKIKELYLKHTGKNPDEELKESLDAFAKEFVEQNQTAGSTPQPTSQNPDNSQHTA